MTLGWIGVAKFPYVKVHDWSSEPHRMLKYEEDLLAVPIDWHMAGMW